jgi:short-subunit dehydrogenase
LAPKLDSLILVARRVERLEQVAKDLHARFPALDIRIEVADLSIPQTVQDLLRRLEAHPLDVDVLVNNAGLGESEFVRKIIVEQDSSDGRGQHCPG